MTFPGFLIFEDFIFLKRINSALIIAIACFFARKIGRSGRFSRSQAFLSHQVAPPGMRVCSFLAQLMLRSMFQQMALITNRALLRSLVLAFAQRIP